MLEFMHKHAKYFYVFFFVVIISFIFFYVGPIDNDTSPVLAEVGGEKIHLDEYWRAYERYRRFYRDKFGKDIDKKTEEELNLKRRVLDDLVDERVLLKKARELGLRVTDRELQEAIMRESAFMDNGVFSRELYLRTLDMNRLSPRQYESMVRRQLLLVKVRALLGEAVDLTDDDLKGLQGNEAFYEAIKDAVLRDKRDRVIRSYVQTLKRSMDVRVDYDLIS